VALPFYREIYEKTERKALIDRIEQLTIECNEWRSRFEATLEARVEQLANQLDEKQDKY
jgi:hypothetical protein